MSMIRKILNISLIVLLTNSALTGTFSSPTVPTNYNLIGSQSLSQEGMGLQGSAKQYLPSYSYVNNGQNEQTNANNFVSPPGQYQWGVAGINNNGLQNFNTGALGSNVGNGLIAGTTGVNVLNNNLASLGPVSGFSQLKPNRLSIPIVPLPEVKTTKIENMMGTLSS